MLEIGCGTGQLTRQLATRGVELTAIDIGPRMVEVAGRQPEMSGVRFQASSFEDFDAPDDSFDLIVSATAFHWIDPDVAWTKSARLLRSCSRGVKEVGLVQSTWATMAQLAR